MVIPNTLWYSSLLSLLTLLSCQSSSSINRKNTTYLFVLHQYVSIINLNYKKEEAMGFRVRLTSNFLPPSSRRDPRHQEDFERIFKIPTPRTFQSVEELTSRDQARPQGRKQEKEKEN